MRVLDGLGHHANCWYTAVGLTYLNSGCLLPVQLVSKQNTLRRETPRTRGTDVHERARDKKGGSKTNKNQVQKKQRRLQKQENTQQESARGRCGSTAGSDWPGRRRTSWREKQ